MRPEGPCRRIVSLVPSVTEALFALGLGEHVVGVTDFCVHPADAVARLPRVRGTKNPDLERVLALRPDLVIANREENRRRDVEKLRTAGVTVWVTYPRTVAEGIALLRELSQLGAPPELAHRIVDDAESALSEAPAPAAEVPTFCPIWRDPWMTIGADTYIHDMLRVCGGKNVFAGRGDRRYPRVRLEEVVAARPEVVLLPDEPYRFGEADRAELAALDLPAARSGRIHLIDGTLLSWYGPRIARAIREIRSLLGDGG